MAQMTMMAMTDHDRPALSLLLGVICLVRHLALLLRTSS
jgi:hypothetical protein